VQLNALAAAAAAAAAPKSRLKYLQTPATPWQQLLVYEVGQQGALAGPYNCSSSGSCADSATDQSSSECVPDSNTAATAAAAVAAAENSNSSSEGGLQDAMQLPQMTYSHVVYVCCK
jgi:hypothetical protein